MNLLAVFITGLTTGALSCVAVQGGLLASVIASQKGLQIETKSKVNKGLEPRDFMPVLLFLVTKLVAHIILGFLLGSLGSVMTLSLSAKIVFQFFTAIYMLATAMNLLELHPVFRYVVIQPPRFITRRISRLSKNGAWFTPAILGLFTVLIPCGVTQAMEVVAINSGDPLQGALIMGAFVLGTTPLFALIGIATSQLSDRWRGKFLKIAAYLLILMSLYTFNGVLQVMDAPVSYQKIINVYQRVKEFESEDGKQAVDTVAETSGKQLVNIEATSHGYSPTKVAVKVGVPVELTLTSVDAYSCAVAFVFREFGIKTMLKANDKQVFNFTPSKKGSFTYSCSMGMYTGVMEVI